MFSRYIVHPGAGHLVNAVSGAGLMVPVSVEVGTVPAAFSFAKLLRLWQLRASERRALARLDDHALADIGMTRGEALVEAAKPFWRR